MDINSNFHLNSYHGLQEKLTEIGSVMNFVSGDIILREDQYVKGVPIVLNGTVKVLRKDVSGKEILLYYINDGESCVMSFFGAMNQEKSQVIAVAENDVELIFIPNDMVNKLQRENTQWSDYILKLYHMRFEELISVINSIAFKRMDQRIIEFLRNKSMVTGSKDIQITHHTIAEELGTARAVVSRLIKQMEIDGLVVLGRNKVTLV